MRHEAVLALLRGLREAQAGGLCLVTSVPLPLGADANEVRNDVSLHGFPRPRGTSGAVFAHRNDVVRHPRRTHRNDLMRHAERCRRTRHSLGRHTVMSRDMLDGPASQLFTTRHRKAVASAIKPRCFVKNAVLPGAHSCCRTRFWEQRLAPRVMSLVHPRRSGSAGEGPSHIRRRCDARQTQLIVLADRR